jgi:hypothetical protein
MATTAPSTLANLGLGVALFAWVALACRAMENARQRKRKGQQ